MYALLLPIFTGIIARSTTRSTTRQYLSYPEADFEVFRPTGATRCTDFLDATMYLNVSRFENFTSHISTPALKATEKRDS